MVTVCVPLPCALLLFLGFIESSSLLLLELLLELLLLSLLQLLLLLLLQLLELDPAAVVCVGLLLAVGGLVTIDVV